MAAPKLARPSQLSTNPGVDAGAMSWAQTLVDQLETRQVDAGTLGGLPASSFWQHSLDFNYIRVQGTITWSAADANSRDYAPLNVTTMVQDYGSNFSLSGGKLTVPAKNLVVGWAYLHGAGSTASAGAIDGNYKNGTAVDVGITWNTGAVAVADAVSQCGFFITPYFLTNGSGTIQPRGWNTAGGTGTVILTVIVLPT